MKKAPHRADLRRTSGIYRYILLILICVLFIALYTFTLQKKLQQHHAANGGGSQQQLL